VPPSIARTMTASSVSRPWPSNVNVFAPRRSLATMPDDDDTEPIGIRFVTSERAQ
jgi:hypothetical protein